MPVATAAGGGHDQRLEIEPVDGADGALGDRVGDVVGPLVGAAEQLSAIEVDDIEVETIEANADHDLDRGAARHQVRDDVRLDDAQRLRARHQAAPTLPLLLDERLVELAKIQNQRAKVDRRHLIPVKVTLHADDLQQGVQRHEQ